MRNSSAGFSTLGLASILLALTVLVGGGYFLFSSSHKATMQETHIIKTTVAPDTKKISVKPSQAITQGCTGVGKNPNLMKRYENTDAVSCGFIPPGNSNSAIIENVRSCLEAALANCKVSKSYIYVQGFEGALEYSVNTNNCEILIERWGTMEPYCGYDIGSCKELSTNFPYEICPGTVEQSDIAQPKELTKQDMSGVSSSTACVSEADCFSKTSCPESKKQLCSSHPACVNNRCVCLEVCR